MTRPSPSAASEIVQSFAAEYINAYPWAKAEGIERVKAALTDTIAAALSAASEEAEQKARERWGKARGWLRHKDYCFGAYKPERCNCGFRELLDSLDTVPDAPPATSEGRREGE